MYVHTQGLSKFFALEDLLTLGPFLRSLFQLVPTISEGELHFRLMSGMGALCQQSEGLFCVSAPEPSPTIPRSGRCVLQPPPQCGPGGVGGHVGMPAAAYVHQQI